MGTWNVGVVGVGNISGIYLENLGAYARTQVVSCADLDMDRAKSVAEAKGIPKAQTVDALLADTEVDVVLNLTVPKAHYAVSKAALEAGKHVYVEKPLSVNRDEARELKELADAKGLRLGCAPDTVLGAGIQTCRKLIDDGAIGEPVGANAFMLCPGHESWHPSPEFYYEKGGGPMLDMGPYYVTALVTLLGGVGSVFAECRTPRATRTITSEPKKGKVVPVETPTHIVGLLSFQNGAVGQITTSFDVQRTTLPCIEVYGSEGSILVPDPNGFGGPVKLFRKGESDWHEVPLTHGFAKNSRGLGLLDLVCAIDYSRPNRVDGGLSYHVTDVMLSLLDASDKGTRMALNSAVERPAPMPGATDERDLPG
ncbi:MAG: Gfo/Idh/MocA family oxidoreductase [Armatimonadetes bacterium]|nr:Gfo/Idh/MocA family oxidoreductase [Armatimonadota bacterium]